MKVMTLSARLVCGTLLLVGVALTALGAPPARQASDPVGLKIVLRQRFPIGDDATARRITTTTTTYLLADRKREEWRTARAAGVAIGPRTVTITRCDLGKSLSVNLVDREYFVQPAPSLAMAAALKAHPPRPAMAPPSPPNLLIEKTTVDTGERKMMFGYQARHVITTQKHTPLDPGVSDNHETVTDGWYIDLDTAVPCDLPLRASGVDYVTVTLVDSRSKNPLPPMPGVSAKITGRPESGFVIASTVTSRSHGLLPDGTRDDTASVLEMEVTEITHGHLDPALFEVPAGFHDVSPGTIWYYWKNARAWVHYTIARILG